MDLNSIIPTHRSSFPGTAIILSAIALLSLAFVLAHPGFMVKLSVAGALLFVAFLSNAVFAVHAVVLSGLLVLPGLVFPLFQAWPFTLLGPLFLYGAVVLAIPSLRHSVGWVRRGTVDRKVVLLIIAAVLLSSLALVAWVLWLRPDIRPYLALLPVLPVWGYPFVGLGFAVLNAAMEEIVFRGIIMEAVDSAAGPGYGSVCIQAVPFAALHYYAGFPNGLVGLAMTFAYGVMLGAIRRISRGMLAPFLTHVAADMTIFSIVLWIYFGLRSGS